MRNPISRRNRTACSILALATALAVGPSPAAAQSYLGSGSPLVAGSATITTPTGSSTQVVVNNPQTVITWTPTDNATSTSPIVFQAGGTNTAFVMGGSNYAVLNRIIATDQTRQIQFFGTTSSFVGSVNGPVGGAVYFYAPGGFLLGGGSAFNVGSLVMSALPIAFDANGTFITGARNQVVFGQATQPNATVTTNPGSSITALGNPGANAFGNSYVALVAPRVIRGGDIAVNGQAAVVAAEAATIRFAPDGLFDIEVTSGTSQANGITGAGDITGPASSGAGDNHRVYMVAVPKNQAMSLALSQGTVLGFDIAQAVNVDGNAIVLSAGHDVLFGGAQSARSPGSGTGASNISANAISATSTLSALATGEASFFSNAGEASNFASDLTVFGQILAWGSASGSDSSFNVVGDIVLNSDVSANAEGGSATGGWAALYAQNGGFVSIGGSAFLSASGYGAGSGTAGLDGGAGTGGRAWIQAEAGSGMFITGSATASALGFGGFGFGAGSAGGAGAGGEALIRAFGVGSVLGIDGNAEASAQAYAGGASNGNGGLGTGGDAGIYADIGSLTIDGSLLAITSAYGGDGGGAGNSSGDGVGGDSYVYANGGGALTVAGQIQVASHAFGGVDTSGLAASGAGLAGDSSLYAFAGGDVSGGSASVQANGYGGPFGECTGCGGAAAIGQGGTADISATGTGSTVTLTGVNLAAGGTGSNGVVDQGGDGFGGYAEMWANSGGAITVNGNAFLSANGIGGVDFGGFGAGDGFGGGYFGDGYAEINTYGSNPSTSITVTGTVDVRANGTGGNSATAPGLRIAGDGFGGSAEINAFGGGISLASTTVSAIGSGGNATGGTGGDGTGGDSSVSAAGGNISITGNGNVRSFGQGGSGAIGGTGNGGGDVLDQFGGAGLYASGTGLLTISGQVTVNARGVGGAGTTFGGAANGGVAQVVAGGGGDVDLLGLTIITSDAVAGAGADGRGGVSLAFAGSGSTIDFNTLNLRADGYGGNQIGIDVGDGYGGTATIEASGAGAVITLANSIAGVSQDTETLSADGFGGNTAIAGGNAGTGFGGTGNLFSNSGGVVTLASAAGTGNPLLFRARGYGGDPDAEGATGGIGDGGVLNLVVNGGTMTLGSSQYSSIGEGGFTNLLGLNTNGGDGLGGERHITVLGGGILNAWIPGGVAGGIGAAGTGTGSGGDGSGGIATLTVDSSTFNVTGNTTISSQSGGGTAESGTGGSSLGGQTSTATITNSTINIASGATLFIGANGYGGSADGNGGNAQAGTSTVNIANSTINTGSLHVFTTASGGGGDTGGGNSAAGTAIVTMTGSTFAGQNFIIDSTGYGGAATNGIAGNGTGGTAQLNSGGGTSSITASGTFGVFAEGGGGSIVDGNGTTGNGIGGVASVFAGSGSTLNLNGNFIVSAEADGGTFVDSTNPGTPSGNGGFGDGGTASVFANNGTVNVTGNLTVSGAATGTSGIGGTGGNALGGRAALASVAGAINVSGTTTLNGSATAGNGTIGGNALGLISIAEEQDPTAASIYAQDGGTITLTGSVLINAGASGGNSTNGNGGTATAGEVDVVPYVGTLTLGNTTINATALGGSGGLGGNGGNAVGGTVDVAFGLFSAPINATTTLGTVDINASAAGGAGGAGTSAGSGGDGGAGGAGTGGDIGFVGSAAGGTLNSGNVVLTANGIGGAGGVGGNGDGGPGGDGGAGGVGTGGFIQAGTISNMNSPGSGGDFNSGNLSISTNGIGGAGGNGGSGGVSPSDSGIGGNGGNGLGGQSYFLIRGVDGSAGAVTLSANGTGGNGGTGTTRGNGGNAFTGLVQAESRERFGHPTQRGNLVANSIVATAVATGGDGAAVGLETIYGGSYFALFNGDATIGSVSFTIGGDIYNTSFGSDYVSVRDGTANIGTFSYTTTGGLTLDAGNGTMIVTNLALDAATFLPSNPTTLPAPSVTGTYQATNLSVATDDDFLTNANLAVVNAVAITAPGEIIARNISSGTSNVTLGSAAGITAANITAAGNLTAQTNGAMTLGNLSSGGNLLAESTGALVLQNVSAFGDVDLGSNTSLVALDVSAGNEIYARIGGFAALQDLTAGADINIGAIGALGFATAAAGQIIRLGSDVSITGTTLTAGDSVVALSLGNIQFTDVSAGIVGPSTAEGALYEVALITAGAITTQNINAAGDVQLASAGGITTGDVSTTERMFAISNADINLGDLTVGGQLLVGAYQLQYTGELDVDSTFDARPTFNALPDLVNVPNVTIASIDAGFVELSGNVVMIGAITADTTVDLESLGNLTFGNVSASDFNFSAGGAVMGGNIVATEHADGEAQGAIVVGNVTVTGAPIEDDFSVGFQSLTSITTGNISAFANAGFATTGTLTTGTIDAGNLIMALVGGNVVTGALTTGTGGQVYIGNSSMFTAAGGPDNFDVNLVLAVDPVATGGSLTINGAIDTPVFRAAIGNAFAIGDISVEGGFAVEASSITTGDITATTFIDLTATGAISTGDLFAGTSVTLDGGSVTTGAIKAGLGVPAQGPVVFDVGPGNSVEIFSDSSIVTGPITTDGYVGLYAATDITAGTITADHDVIALAGGNATFGAITTPERFILAGYGNFASLQGDGFDPELIFGLFPIASTGGNATFAGSSSALQFEAYVGGNTVVQSITVTPDLSEFPVLGSGGYIRLDTGGTLAIAGQLTGDYIDFVSSDINISPQAQITAEGVSFNSINSVGTYIGDNLAGTGGYRLSQAEIDRVNASFYGFDVLPGRGAAQIMLIGDLSLDLSGGLDDEGVDFEIESDDLDEDGDGLVGLIRIVGDVSITSDTDKTIYFTAETFALDAATGSLSLTDGSGNLNGLLDIEATNIFVASGTIIDKLLVDPRYPGHVAELNAPAAVQRPEGVIRAGAIDFGGDDNSVQNLIVQNTGTIETPAGFVVLSESAYYDGQQEGDDEEDFPAAGSINLVINGQIVTPTGTLTGIAVRDALVDDYGSTEPFTASSTINGCALSGATCNQPTGGGVVPPTAVVTPTQVSILSVDPIGESVFGNEGDIAGADGADGGEGGEGGDDGGAGSPIDAPQPLFDTRPLSSDEDVNEPVSGAGNPSLYGVSSDEDDDEDEDEEGETEKKGEAKPAGQPNARTGDGK